MKYSTISWCRMPDSGRTIHFITDIYVRGTAKQKQVGGRLMCIDGSTMHMGMFRKQSRQSKIDGHLGKMMIRGVHRFDWFDFLAKL